MEWESQGGCSGAKEGVSRRRVSREEAEAETGNRLSSGGVGGNCNLDKRDGRKR